MQEQERRAKQRFPIQLPVVIRSAPSEIRGVSRDVSAAGVFFYTDHWPFGFSPIEFRMILPAQITGTESIRVVCKGTVVRVELDPQAKTGVATTIDSFTFGQRELP
jgi:PilZ domain